MLRRGNLAERTAPDGWILHCVQNDIRKSASTAHNNPILPCHSEGTE